MRGSGRPRRIAIGASLAVTAVIAVLVWQVARDADSGAARTIPTGADDWVLVTAFENHTGEPVFDGTLDYVLRQQLSASPRVRVASSDRVRDALRLMQRPLDARIDVALGREISLRDGGIRVLVSGRIDKTGSRYSLSLDLIDPSEGRIVAADRRSVDRQDGVLDALSDQAEWVRRRLGERLPAMQRLPRLERVSTTSLEALQLYSQAMELGMQFQWAPAAKLLEAAVARDPAFASAHMLLAHALANVGQPWHDVLRQSERARAHAAEVSEVERYFIEGSHLTFEANVPPVSPLDRLQAATAAYEAVRRLDPHHYWAANNLMLTYERLGRVDLAVPLAVEHATERPNDVRAQALAARALTAWEGDVARARPFVTQARSLVSAGLPLQAQWRSWLDLFDAHAAWVDGDVTRVRDLIDRQAARLPELIGEDLEHYAQRVGQMYLALGRCDDARRAFERMGDEYRHEALGLGALQCDDHQAFVSEMLADVRNNDQPSYPRVMLGPRTGRLADAEAWIADFRRRFANRLTMIVAEAELAAARGDWQTAVQGLEIAWQELRLRGQERTPRIAERLAEAYVRTGRTARALEVLEATTPLRAKVYEFTGPPGGLAWIRAQTALARLYRSLGRPDAASNVGALVRPLLAEADPNLPLLRELGHHTGRAALSTPGR